MQSRCQHRKHSSQCSTEGVLQHLTPPSIQSFRLALPVVLGGTVSKAPHVADTLTKPEGQSQRLDFYSQHPDCQLTLQNGQRLPPKTVTKGHDSRHFSGYKGRNDRSVETQAETGAFWLASTRGFA